MLMFSRSDMIWTMPVLRCHFQIEAIQMKLRWRKKIVLLPSEWCTTIEVDPTSKKLLWHYPKMSLGLKIVEILSPSGHTPPLPRVTEQYPGPPLGHPSDGYNDILHNCLWISIESTGSNKRRSMLSIHCHYSEFRSGVYRVGWHVISKLIDAEIN